MKRGHIREYGGEGMDEEGGMKEGVGGESNIKLQGWNL